MIREEEYLSTVQMQKLVREPRDKEMEERNHGVLE